MPKPDDTIVYVQGSWDLLHHGHLKRLEAAKALGTFLYVGIWDDEMTRYYRGENYPIVSLQERVLMVLACKHVDDVVIGAPYIITDDLVKSLNISKVVNITGTDEDIAKPSFRKVDQFEQLRESQACKIDTVHIEDPFYDVTTESIAERVLQHKEQFEAKYAKKIASQNKYYADHKAYISEQ